MFKRLSQLIVWVISVLIPVSPLVMFLLFGEKKFIVAYSDSVKKMRIHLQALSEGPVLHFLEDVCLRKKNIPVQIQGSCVQCGNCCLEKKCFFLEPMGEDKFQCGIYDSVWRRFSNCNSYPLHAEDIERYNCPSYSVVPVRLRIHAATGEKSTGNQLTNPL
jgi:hypothetical protein